jgi:mono/diheme cytochrome c family protein
MAAGISTRNAPGRVETALARRARSLAIPSASRNRSNPVLATAETIEAGLRHFADHCAVCHANDGSGDTVMGRGLYPRAPDMRTAATQSLKDGELFYIIEHGVRLTGMPGWGTGSPESEEASWKLVHFIRHLPVITGGELSEMRRLNPKGAEDQTDPDEFLKGTDRAPSVKHGHEH